MKWVSTSEYPTIRGLKLSGDPRAPRTRWWNQWFIQLFWKETTVLEVPAGVAERGYHIGFVPMETSDLPKVTASPVHHLRFQVRHGREECKFFIVSGGEEVPLVSIVRTTKNSKKYKRVPLY